MIQFLHQIETRKNSEPSGASTFFFPSFYLMQKMYHVLLLQKDSIRDSIFGVNEQLDYFLLICQPLREGFK